MFFSFQVKEALSEKGLSKYVRAIVAIRSDIDVKLRKVSEASQTFINELFEFQDIFGRMKVRIIIFLRGTQTHVNCRKLCHWEGSQCVYVPFTRLVECQCKKNFDGLKCETHNNNHLASALELLVEETVKVPTLIDIYHNVENLREEIEYGFADLNAGIRKLTTTLETAYKNILKQLQQLFKWQNLRVNYAETISNIKHFIDEFNQASKKNDKQRMKDLAKYLLSPGKLRKWMRDLNTLFVGSENVVQYHEPLMIMYMKWYQNDACSDRYKSRIDEAFQQFAVLQSEGFIMWMQSAEILEMDPRVAAEKFKTQLKNQV